MQIKGRNKKPTKLEYFTVEAQRMVQLSDGILKAGRKLVRKLDQLLFGFALAGGFRLAVFVA